MSDRAGRPVEAPLNIEANMSHAGMVPVFTTARREQPGRYSARFDFTMAGDWFVTLRSRLPNGAEFTRDIAIAGVNGR